MTQLSRVKSILYDNMTLGNRLKQFAESRYSNVAEFSKQLGINRENAYRYFKDVVSPGAELLIRLAEMGCDINWLLTGIKEFFRQTKRTKSSYSNR